MTKYQPFLSKNNKIIFKHTIPKTLVLHTQTFVVSRRATTTIATTMIATTTIATSTSCAAGPTAWGKTFDNNYHCVYAGMNMVHAVRSDEVRAEKYLYLSFGDEKFLYSSQSFYESNLNYMFLIYTKKCSSVYTLLSHRL